MNVPDISGWWLSALGKIAYFITQMDEAFVWRTIHPNGVEETGIGRFISSESESDAGEVVTLRLEARWNFHDGVVTAPIQSDMGTVRMNGNRAIQIVWDNSKDALNRLP